MKYILSVGINDYRTVLGGVNKVILAHQEMFQKNGYEYIYIYPVLKNGEKNKYWKVIINNQYAAIQDTSGLLNYLYKLQKSKHTCTEIHIHHLLNVSIRNLDELLINIQSPIKFYIHDYYTICPSIKMLRNDTTFCGCEKMSSVKCSGCRCYSDGKKKNILIRKLIARYAGRIIFIAPSEVAKEEWIKAYPEYKEQVLVIYHQELKGNYKGNSHPIEDNGIIKIAYIGEPMHSKGFSMWNMILENNRDYRYEFYYLGNRHTKLINVKTINVDFRKKIDAMTTALREHDIDCILLWSILPETYSYTYYEGMSANAFILTNMNSGNIAFQVKKNGNGMVFHDENNLIDLLNNYDKFRTIINRFKLQEQKGPADLTENEEIVSHIDPSPKKPVLQPPDQSFSPAVQALTIIFKLVEIIRRLK